LKTDRKTPVIDADHLSEEEKARHLRLLALRERAAEAAAAPAADGDDGNGEVSAADAAPGAAPAASAATAEDGEAKTQGQEINEFLQQLIEKRKSRHYQLQMIQDFFENPVEFGVEVDYIPSGTSLVEIRSRQKDLRYRITLLRTVLEAFEGELEMLNQAELSALMPAEEGSAGPGASPAHSDGSAEASSPSTGSSGGN
jgi:hypothetical protein